MTLLVRHAESEWNRAFGAFRVDPGLPDPGLTEEGVRQAEALAPLVAAEGVLRIVTSPYRRTLQTAAILNARLGLPVELDPDVRERCAFSCDQGSRPDVLAREWPGIDFGGLEACWWGGMIESADSLRERCARFRERLAAREDRARLLVVTHYGFIRGLTGLEVKNATRVRLGDAGTAEQLQGAPPP